MDRTLAEFLTQHRPLLLEWLARAITLLGSSWVAALALVLLAFTATHIGRLRRWLMVTTGWVANLLIVETMKFVIQRPRPPAEWAVGTVDNWSMPSAHAARAALVATFWYLVRRGRLDAVTRRRFRTASVAFVVLIGWSRVELGLHWPSDVVVGALIGSVIALDVVWIFTKER